MRPIELCCLALALASVPALAADQAAAVEQVDIDLIEFLGTFTTPDGEFIDPAGWMADDIRIAATTLPDREQEEVKHEPAD